MLLDKGYEIHGLVRRSSTLDQSRLRHLVADKSVYESRLFLHFADLTDANSIRSLINQVRPTEFYHLAGQSHVGLSFELPESTCELTAMGALRIMEIVRAQANPPRFLHASSREIFGSPSHSPQNESTEINPTSPYGCAKAFATQMTRVYRESHGLFFCNAICYNHESPRRSEDFITRKISLAAARIKLGLQKKLTLGNLDAARDWGYAKDFVAGMWSVLQQDTPQDFVFATGESHTIREVLETAFGHVALDWQDYVEIDPQFHRPADPCQILGDASLARNTLGWAPSIGFHDLVIRMVNHDLALHA